MKTEALFAAGLLLLVLSCPAMSGEPRLLRVEVDELGNEYRVCLQGSADDYEFNLADIEGSPGGTAPRAFFARIKDKAGRLVGDEFGQYSPYYTYLSQMPHPVDFRKLLAEEEYCSQWFETADRLRGLHLWTDSSAENWMSLKIGAHVQLLSGEYLKSETKWFQISQALRDVLLKQEREPDLPELVPLGVVP